MISFVLNGDTVSLDIEGDTPLLWVLRENLGLPGTKFGCGMAQCGACTVHLDGVAIRSCVMPVDAIAGRHVTTIEGIGDGQELHVVQQAWVEANVPQCGYCQSGQIMSAVALLESKSPVTDDDISAAMSGNICRCGMYDRIRLAIHRAAALKAADSGGQQSGNGVELFDPDGLLVRGA